MTNDEIHKAIAVAMQIPESCIREVEGRGLVYWVRNGDQLIERDIPNYTHDLNAMADARNSLNKKQRDAFLRELQIVISCHEPDDNGWLWLCVNATPMEMAIAFLRSLNKLR